MQLKRLSFLLLFICGYLTCVQSQTTVLNPQTDKKLLKQFQDAKLGLFIHWMACHSPGTGDSWAIGNGTKGIIHGLASANDGGKTHKVSLYLTAVQIHSNLVKYTGSVIEVDAYEGIDDIPLDEDLGNVGGVEV